MKRNTKNPSAPNAFIDIEASIGPQMAPMPIRIAIAELAGTISWGCK